MQRQRIAPAVLPLEGLDLSSPLAVVDAPFKALPQLNRRPGPLAHGSRSRPRPGPWLADYFGGDVMMDKLARALFDAQALPYKEVLEGFEFVARARRRLRVPVVADLCCGHGLAGMLMGVLHREVTRVLLVDRVLPPSAQVTLAALATVAPWLTAKVEFHQTDLATVPLDPGAALIGLHACGVRSDAILDRAIAVRGPVALLPCCHPNRAVPGPSSLIAPLGAALATDVARTHRLHDAGFDTRWDAIPATISPKNRVILGWPSVRRG